jgi:hypothetical protein
MANNSDVRARAALILAVALMLVAPLPVAAASLSGPAELRADLDGRSIVLSDVGQHFCEDFTTPVIHCFSKAADLEASVAPRLASATGNYVIIYDFTGYAGSYMYISQDYTVLATIGWNDRISSYVALNSNLGHFFTDWFYGGTQYGFCCNQQVPALGIYDNTFSSVHRF